MLKLADPKIPENAIRKVVEVLRSGNLIQGKYVEEFENKLSAFLGVKHSILVSSGTSALILSLKSLEISHGDEVIITAFTFPATANAVEISGARTIIKDINLSDFCIDTNDLENFYTSNTKIIMPVHEFGQPADMNTIMKFAKKHKLYVVEDAACAFGSKYSNRWAGTIGDMGCFSFHPRKSLTTGEGGLVVTNRDDLAEKVRSLRNHGIKRFNDKKTDFLYAGYNFRLTDFQAAMGLSQIGDLENRIKKCLDLAHFYNENLKGIDWITTPKSFEERRETYQTYHVLLNINIDRYSLIEYLRKNQIESNYGAQAINCLDYYKKKYNFNDESCPNATLSYHKGLALPIGPHVSFEDVLNIVELLNNWKIVYENK